MSSSETIAIGQLATAGNVLSLIGCAVIVTWYIMTRRKNAPQSAGSGHVTVHHTALLNMAITNILLNIGGLIYSGIGYADNRSVCVLQGLHITYFNLSNWLWTLCISINILFILKRVNVYPDHLGKVFCLICWVVPFIMIIPLIATRDTSIVNIGPWCWIPGNRNDLRYGTFYGWLIATYFANVGILAILVYTAYQKRNTNIGSSEERIVSGSTSNNALKSSPLIATSGNGIRGSATLNVPNGNNNNNNDGGGGAVPLKGGSSPRSTTSPQRANTAIRRPDPYAGLVQRYVSYVFVILFCWIFGIALRVGQVSNPAFNDFNITALHTFFSISQMFWLSIVLVLSTQLQRLSVYLIGNRSTDSFDVFRRRSSATPLHDRRSSRASSTSNPDVDIKPKAKQDDSKNSVPTKIFIKKMISIKEFSPISHADGNV